MATIEVCRAHMVGYPEVQAVLRVDDETGVATWDGAVANMIEDFGSAEQLAATMLGRGWSRSEEFNIALALDKRSSWSVEWLNPFPGYQTEGVRVVV